MVEGRRSRSPDLIPEQVGRYGGAVYHRLPHRAGGRVFDGLGANRSHNLVEDERGPRFLGHGAYDRAGRLGGRCPVRPTVDHRTGDCAEPLLISACCW